MPHVAHPRIATIGRSRPALRRVARRPRAEVTAPLTLAAIVVLGLMFAVTAALVSALPA